MNNYDCAIIGGGLAGLSLAILLQDAGYSVVLFEKNKYPFHKVCGEYISMESWDFICSLGLDLTSMNLPKIDKLTITSQDGYSLNSNLDMGGFGISRYLLDNELANLAKSKGVALYEECKVHKVEKPNDKFEIVSSSGEFTSTLCFGSFGKYLPSYINEVNLRKNTDNFIGVKYHIRTDFEPNKIELHNFQNGYCGISRIENSINCLCYLASGKDLKKYGNIDALEKNLIYKNPHLKKYFTNSEFLFSEPQVISNIKFKKRATNYNGIIALGDAAGSITPLCGNGMSMALRSSFLLSKLVVDFFENKDSLEQIIQNYDKIWNANFLSRVNIGYYLQGLFGKNTMTSIALRLLNNAQPILKKVIRLTHGERFGE